MAKNKQQIPKDRARIRRANTNKIVGKLVHAVSDGKRRKIRERFKKKKAGSVPDVTAKDLHEKLKFGCINVDGMDLQTDDAVRSLIVDRKIDVSCVFTCQI